MAITRKVDMDVYCDICGKWVMGWTSNNDGVSRAWAAKYARKKGCTVGKKIICKECRILSYSGTVRKKSLYILDLLRQ